MTLREVPLARLPPGLRFQPDQARDQNKSFRLILRITPKALRGKRGAVEVFESRDGQEPIPATIGPRSFAGDVTALMGTAARRPTALFAQ